MIISLDSIVRRRGELGGVGYCYVEMKNITIV